MIIDNINHLGRYAGLDQGIDRAFRFLREKGPAHDLADGAYEIDGNSVTAVIITADTVSTVESRMEIHKEYLDIHFMLNGEESFGFSSEFRPDSDYDEQNDIVFGSGNGEVFYHARKGDFYIIWPEEAHRPLTRVSGVSSEVRKIIFKVKIHGKENESTQS